VVIAEDILRGSSESAKVNHRAWVFVGFGLMIIVALGFWGLTAGGDTVSTIGTAIDHDGGTYTAVDAWTIDDPMTAMMGGANADQFAQSGMPMGQMSQMMSDAVPEGMKRVAVELDIHAGDQQMAFPTEQITLDAGGQTFHPYGSLLADESLTPGSRLSGIVIFEVPIDTATATFRLNGDAPSVTVDVSKGPGGRAPATHDHED
jgi:hypothetical protein